MQSFRNPKWVFLVNTGPVVLLLALGYGEFSIIRTLLPPESVAQWQWVGGALVLLGVGGAAYAAVCWRRGAGVGAAVSLGALLAYSLLLCLVMARASELLPWAVPRWMVPTDPVLMAWTFLMPTLAYALLVLVARFTPEDGAHHAVPNILFAVAAPMGWAVVFWVLGLVSGFIPWSGFETGVFVAAMVVSTLSFFFFLVRAVYIVSLRKAGFWADSALVWKGVVTIGLPLLGLAVNNGLLFGQGFRQEHGIFGNFVSPWFYVLALVNGALLCMPGSARPGLRRLQLLCRSALFGYTLYFFLLFLPFLPLSIPAIILIGTGFLLLAPTLLFVVHVRQLGDDIVFLRGVYSRAAVGAVLVAGLLALPLFITGRYWHSRRVLHEALAYVYTPNFSKPVRLDAAALARTLATIKEHKARNNDLFSGTQLPYLSMYFNWLVLDNLMLSDAKIADLERIFTGVAGPPAVQTWRDRTVELDDLRSPNGPVLRALRASSTYDARQQAWVSWVSLEIANADTTVRNGEYGTRFVLPTGCWVSDYYLTIGKRQEQGILAEKKAAAWVFAQILSENQNRDPGLLSYTGPNEVALRVFPVTGPAVRRTRMQLLHKESITLTIDGQMVNLGNDTTAPPVAAPVASPDGGVVYLSAQAKKSLPLVQRRPYYHFLVDASARRGAPMPEYRARIERQMAQSLPNGAAARFSLVDAYTTLLPAGADWQQALESHRPEGGFYLTGALQRVLAESQRNPTPTYPVVVVVTDDLQKAVLAPDFAEFRSAFPESDVFYELTRTGRLLPHSLLGASSQPQASPTQVAMPVAAPPVANQPPPAPAVRAWPTAARPRAYVPDNDQADIVLNRAPTVPAASAVAANRWLAGLLLRGHSQWQTFHPETVDRERVPFIQASFRAGIMTPFTSFLALENAAQKAALRQKQAETLAANVSLDTLEENESKPVETPIDSGVLLLLAAGGLLAWWYLRRSSTLAA